MNTQATPENPLLNPVSSATKARLIESLFPNPQSNYADEVTHNLTRVNSVLAGLSIIGDEDQVSGEFVIALSELLAQQIDISIVLLQGSVFDQAKPE